MNAQRLVRQLRREVKANPKRAALLAALLAVGIYFWAPLVAGWVSPSQTAVTQAPGSQASGNQASANPASAVNTSAPIGVNPSTDTRNTESQGTTERVPWTRLWAAIRNDNRTKPARKLPSTIDPFRPFPAPVEPIENDEIDVAGQGTDGINNAQTTPNVGRNVAAAVPTPKSLGMKLTGTIVGGQRRAAVIDGKVVVEGAMVASSDPTQVNAADASASRIAFRLSRVESRWAVLERNGASYKLVIETPNVVGTDFAAVAPISPN